MKRWLRRLPYILLFYAEVRLIMLPVLGWTVARHTGPLAVALMLVSVALWGISLRLFADLG